MKILKLYIVVLPILWLLSCSAPHDNPLDPDSPNYVEPTPPVVEPPAPTFSTSVRSVHTAYIFPPTPTYDARVELWPDSTKQIDSVRVFVNEVSRPLTLTDGHWRASLSSSVFDGSSLENVVGQPFMFSVFTPDDSVWEVGPDHIFRVIRDTPELTSPTRGDTTSPFPTFVWTSLPVLYDIRFVISLSWEYEDGIFGVIWTSDTLASNVLSLTYSDSLVDDSYQWTVTALDDFNNSSRSKEGEFNVQHGVAR